MPTKSDDAPTGLAALAALASVLEQVNAKQAAALAAAPVNPDPAAVERVSKAAVALGRAGLTAYEMRKVEDAAAKAASEAKARRDARMDEASMDDFTPDELEQRAAELRARADRILATFERKYADEQPAVAAVDRVQRGADGLEAGRARGSA